MRKTSTSTLLAGVWLATLVVAVGCARSPGAMGGPGVVPSQRLANTASLPDEADEAQDYDPWQPFNERMFWFNHDVLDRFLVKPVANGWDKIMPAVARRGLDRAFDNIEMPRRLVNNLLQARPLGAGRELARFLVNTTVGVVGFVDVATPLRIAKSDADAGQTLALYGFGAGPYLVLPTMSPSTVRDSIGKGIDGLLDPIGYFAPFVANRASSIVSAINERSLHLKLYADVEDSVLDLYSAARNGYLQRRQHTIEMALAERRREWGWDEDGSPAEIRTVASLTLEDPS